MHTNHKKSNSNMNKSLELWQNRKKRKSPYLNMPLLTNRDHHKQDSEAISAKYVYLQKRIVEKCQEIGKNLPHASIPSDHRIETASHPEDAQASQIVIKPRSRVYKTAGSSRKKDQRNAFNDTMRTSK